MIDRLNARVGGWLIRLLGAALYAVVRWRDEPERRGAFGYEGPETEHRYRVIAPGGVQISGYAGTVRFGEIVFLPNDIARALHGSLERAEEEVALR